MCRCSPVGEANADICYYAVNSMSLPAECTPPSRDSRVTFDPAQAQEALARSFQPFTQHLYADKGAKRPATKDPVGPDRKRFHEDSAGDGDYEVRAGDYILS